MDVLETPQPLDPLALLVPAALPPATAEAAPGSTASGSLFALELQAAQWPVLTTTHPVLVDLATTPDLAPSQFPMVMPAPWQSLPTFTVTVAPTTEPVTPPVDLQRLLSIVHQLAADQSAVGTSAASVLSAGPTEADLEPAALSETPSSESEPTTHEPPLVLLPPVQQPWIVPSAPLVRVTAPTRAVEPTETAPSVTATAAIIPPKVSQKLTPPEPLKAAWTQGAEPRPIASVPAPVAPAVPTPPRGLQPALLPPRSDEPVPPAMSTTTPSNRPILQPLTETAATSLVTEDVTEPTTPLVQITPPLSARDSVPRTLPAPTIATLPGPIALPEPSRVPEAIVPAEPQFTTTPVGTAPVETTPPPPVVPVVADKSAPTVVVPQATVPATRDVAAPTDVAQPVDALPRAELPQVATTETQEPEPVSRSAEPRSAPPTAALTPPPAKLPAPQPQPLPRVEPLPTTSTERGEVPAEADDERESSATTRIIPSGLQEGLSRSLMATPPLAAPETSSAPPNTAARQVMLDHVAQTMVQSHDTQQPLTMQLAPPDLGPLLVQVHQHEGTITARLEAATSQGMQLLVDHLPQLQESLKQLGMTVERVDIVRDETRRDAPAGDSPWGQQSGADPRHQAPSPQPRRPAILRPTATASAHTATEAAATASPVNRDLRLQELNVRV